MFGIVRVGTVLTTQAGNDGASKQKDTMSPKVAAQLEQQLEDNGTLSLNESELKGFFDSRARKLVRMSGEAALERIQSGKCGPNTAWEELALLATLMR